jgi:hypothetical protein
MRSTLISSLSRVLPTSPRARASAGVGVTLAVATALAVSAWTAPAAADVTVFEAPSVGDFSLDLYGWIQPRFTWQQNDVNFNPTPGFSLQRLRLGTIARTGPWAEARVEVDYSGVSPKLIDGYVTLSPIHEKQASLNLTAGYFRVPISRQNLLPSVGYQLADTAYFVNPAFLVDRDLGAKLWTELLDKRIKVEVGMWDSNSSGAGQQGNTNTTFLYGARLEVAPFGPAPRFEGDLRPLGLQHRPIVALGASGMLCKYDNTGYYQKWAGGDLAAYWEGASLYAEIFYNVSDGYAVNGNPAPSAITQFGWNVQAGYFPPVPWVREHLEVAARVEFFDPYTQITAPDPGAVQLSATHPEQGYMGYLFGLNYFLNHKHTLKAQVSYEIRDQTKQCLQGQSLAKNDCTGYYADNLFITQITAGF